MMMIIASISSGITQKNEFDKIRKKWFEIIVGLPEENNGRTDKNMGKYVSQIEKDAEKAIEKLNKEEDKKSLFNDLKDMKTVHIY